MISFEKFFTTVHGYKPFAWQSKMAELMAEDRWYETLEARPATGKTSIIECWFHALYSTILKNDRKIPLRLWFVVDRKVIVDDASQHASKIVSAMNNSVLGEMKTVICNALKIKNPLVVGKIRGGLARQEKNSWLTTPNQPTIVTSTIDQFGSRLLFRGYDVSSKLSSIHAGMASYDCLLVADEAHLSQPLIHTAKHIYSNLFDFGVPKSRIIELSATHSVGNKTKYPIDEELNGDPLLKQRLNAVRKLKLIETNKLADVMAEQAIALLKFGKIIAIICNTVNLARKIHQKLSKKWRSVLLTARNRNYEREKLVTQWLPLIEIPSKGKRSRSKDEPLFVITTQTIEVGANFDFDGMVSQAAPLDCLIQRFGRLDRIGELGTSQGVVVLESPDEDLTITDPVYSGKSISTFEHLRKNSRQGEIENLAEVPIDRDLFAKTIQNVGLSESMFLNLSHTHPAPDISVEGYLHGPKSANSSDVSLVYRCDLNEELLQSNKNKKLGVEIVHPLNHEVLQLPIRCLLKKVDASDSEGAASNIDLEKTWDLRHKLCVRYKDSKVIPIGKARPGDILYVPTDFGFHDEFGWNVESSNLVPDVYESGSYGGMRKHPLTTPDFNLKDYKNLDGSLNEQKLRSIDKRFCNAKIALSPDGLGVYFDVKVRPSYKNEVQTLSYHSERVASFARKFGETVGLFTMLVDLLEKVGFYHDYGKADPRFQDRMYYPDLADPLVLLAKSKKASNGFNPCGLPVGWRHELQSLQMVVDAKIDQQMSDAALFRHLIGSHHGWFRNYLPLAIDKSFKPFDFQGTLAGRAYQEVVNDLTSDFYDLTRRYGPWGLAYLESILRLADHAGSSNE